MHNATDFLNLDFNYGTTNNNGNVLSQTITTPAASGAPAFTAVQTYTYDSLNRIKDARELVGATQTWRQVYSFDRYGNRNFASGTTTIAGCPTNICNPSVNPANNRFNSGQGYTYDLSGNTISDAAGRTYIYDAENKQKQVKNSANQTIGTYFYDGDGKRIKKVTASKTVTFVYNAGGKLVAEYSTLTPQTTPVTRYLTSDHLGSPRIITGSNGAVLSRRDFMPYGEEAFIGVGNRAVGHGYTYGDSTRQKFTGYERDEETNLDYAQARMYSNQLGRFTTVDPLLSSARSELPQSWNRYSYGINSPLVLVDPTGLSWYSKVGENGNTSYQWFDENPGYGWNAVENFTYDAGEGHGWVALDPYSANWTEGHKSGTAAEETISGRLTAWKTTQFFTGMSDGINPINGWVRSKTESIIGSDLNINEQSTPYKGGVGTGLILSTTIGFVAGQASQVTVASNAVTNPIPRNVARVIPGEGRSTTLGPPARTDVFVTAADDISGLNAAQLSKRLTIRKSNVFTVLEFPTPKTGLSSPVFRSDPGFVGFGRTAGGAREFIIPNGPVPANAVTRIVK